MIKDHLTTLKVLLLLATLWSFSSCSSARTGKKRVLRHIVSFQFREGIPEEKKARAIQLFLNLKDEIPEIKKFEGGENISQASLSKKFTHCFILTFESEADRDIYLPHPAHAQVVEANKPLFSDLLVVDVWGKE